MPSGVSDGALIIDTGLDNAGFIRDAAQFKRAVETLTQAVKTSGQQMAGGMDGYLRALQRAGATSKGAASGQAAIQKEIDKTTASIKRLEERQELARRKFEAAKEDAIGRAQEEFQANNAGADAMPWENEEQALEALSEELNRVAQEASDAFGQFEDSAAFRNTSVEIEYLQEKLAALQAQLGQMQSQPQGDGGAAEQARQAGEQAENAAEQASSGWQRFGSVVGQAAGGFLRVAGAAARAGASIARVAGSAALGYLRKLAEGAKNAAIQLAKLSGRAIGSGFKTLGAGIWNGAKALLGFNRAGNQSSDGLKRGLMAVLKYGLGIRGLFALFRRLRTAISEGLGEIAKQNPRVNAQLNSFRAALNGLKGSLASAFAPIFTAVGPALTYLINMLTAAINTIAAFMAALTGQSSYQKAVAGISGAGGAASNAGSAADDAAESYKELKRELAGFDDLDVLGSKDTDSSSGSGGGGGGGGGGAGGLSYTTEEIGSGIVDFVATLKEMWANADYEGIGRIIADGINSAFEKAKDWISWDNLGDKITEVVNGITGIINGLVDGVDWELIGQTFGEGINTLVRTINLLLTGIDWENIGKGFADGLGGLVDTVHWDELGQLFANKLNALIGTIKGFVSNFRWGDAGTAFATTVNGLFDTVKWSDLSDAATKAINGILATMKTLVSGFRWDNAATNISNAINRLFDSVKWEDLSDTATTALNKIIATIKTTVSGFRWANAGETFGNTLNSLFSGTNWTELGKTAAAAIAGPLEAIKNAVSTFSFEDAAKSFADAVNGFFSNEQLWADAGTIVSDAIKGLFTWGTDFLNNLKVEQISADIKAFLKDVDWAGIAQGIWDFLVAALKAIGSLLWELLVETDVPPETAAAVEKEVEQLMSKYHPELVVTWGIDISSENGQAQYDALVKAFQDGLAGKEFKVPAGLEIPAESIAACYNEFVEEWNKIHPEAPLEPILPENVGALIEGQLDGVEAEVPVDPTLPDNAGKVIEDEWAESDTNLEAEVDLTTGDVDKGAQEILEAEDKDVDVTVDSKATGEPDKVLKVSGISSTKIDKTVNTNSSATGAPDKVLQVAGISSTKVDKTVNTNSSATGSPDKVLQVAGISSTKVDKTVNTTSKASGDPDKVLKVSGISGSKVEKTVNTDSKAKGDPDKVLKVSGISDSKKEKTVNTDSKAKGDPDKVLKVAGISDSKKEKDVNTDSKAKGDPNKVLDVAGISSSSTSKKVTVKAVGTGAFNQVYKVINASNNIKKTVTVDFKATGDDKAKKAYARGGVITNGGRSFFFARGGILSGGMARYLGNVPHYAGGTTRAHGTVFVAGEAGPEIMGHINGRTEILNKSQLAQTMYSAVLSAMGQAVSALGTFLSGQLANCTNAIVGALGGLSGVANIQYHAPVMASGTVLPYDVAAQIERAGMDIQNTLDANNEDLIQTIISVAGQIVAAVQAQGRNRQPENTGSGLTAQQLINDINRRAQMFGSSPVLN